MYPVVGHSIRSKADTRRRHFGLDEGDDCFTYKKESQDIFEK